MSVDVSIDVSVDVSEDVSVDVSIDMSVDVSLDVRKPGEVQVISIPKQHQIGQNVILSLPVLHKPLYFTVGEKHHFHIIR